MGLPEAVPPASPPRCPSCSGSPEDGRKFAETQFPSVNMYLPEETDQELVEQELTGIRTSIEDIAGEVENLSEESLEGWKKHYSDAGDRTTNP